ncbi:MAG: acyl-CoA mutase large subunit family protein [Bacteroidetes bacterium]|nr:acyl-CoA mutase large subunit family protein [Bacteroidota bacterium]
MRSGEKKKLFREFPPVSTEAWEERINKDLNGADYTKSLIWNTPEGFSVKPYYRRSDLSQLEYLRSLPGEFPFVRGDKTDNNEWLVRQDIPSSEISEANSIALDAIKHGAQAVGFNAREITTHKQIKHLLKGIDLTKIAIHYFRSRSYPLTAELFLYEVNNRKDDNGRITGSLNFDPISFLLVQGDFYLSWESNLEEATYLVNTLHKRLPQVKVININGYRFQDAGSNLVQELAFSLASGNEYLAGLVTKGVDPDVGASRIAFTFALGPSYFMEIAKLRAARLLWAKIVEQYKPARIESCVMDIHCVTARWNKTIFDPYVNMLRTTTEGMSGALGNTDSLSISPFDIAFQKPNSFAERNARNQQLIFKEESHLDKVVDPAAGSYYVENLTDSIACEAWNLFKLVEEKGGIIECIKSGFIQDSVTESRQQKEMDIAQRKFLVLGTNQYPNVTENILREIPIEIEKDEEKTTTYKRMPRFRAGEVFERLRLATERYVEDGNKQPSVFLFTMGNLAMMRVRASFATNFFGCAGYRIIDNPGFASIDEGVDAAIASKTEIVVICSSDDEYAGIVPEIIRKLKEHNSSIMIIIAGYPKEMVKDLRGAGVDDFIHIRSNLLHELTKYQRRLGIQ